MAERTSSVSLSLDRIARTPLRNKREIDRASLMSVSRTIAASAIGSSNKSRIESESMTITSSSARRANDTRAATASKLPARWNSVWLRMTLSSPARRTAEVATTAIRIAPPPFRCDIRYRALSPKLIETGLISPARITLICRTSPIFAMASESWIASTCSTLFPPTSKRTSPSNTPPFYGFEGGIGFIPFAGIGWGAIKAIRKDDSSPVRAAAAKVLAKDPDPAATKALADAVGDKSWLVRAAALEALAKRGDPSVLDTVQLYVSIKKTR